ncbi:hypothetical protein FKP32DRAFT_1688230 [Trametes sanguinea]|nr:hypothetical protein FKP32DRAFT_1688230 [Trametes sanguinea]
MQHARLLSPRHLRPLVARSLRHGISRTFTVLALESSADDTCAAVVTSDRQILSNVVINQQSFIEEYGGIHPFIALHAHQRNMPGAVRRALADANLAVHDVDGIAFTRGPGIPGCLSVCGNAARTLAAALDKPLVGVHHMRRGSASARAHASADLSALRAPLNFPFLTPPRPRAALPSSSSRPRARPSRILATTLDESIGNAYDKVAKLLKIPLQGRAPGAALERYCTSEPPGAEEDAPDIPMPTAMPGKLAFSYSAPHSAVERFLAARGGAGELDERTRVRLARGFQRAAVGQLEEKLVLGMRELARQGVKVTSLVVSGGVASNAFLRERLRACLDAESPDERISLVFPPPSLCTAPPTTDNAVMIAWAAMDRFLAGDTDPYSIESRPKWSLEELEGPERPVDVSSQDSLRSL